MVLFGLPFFLQHSSLASVLCTYMSCHAQEHTRPRYTLHSMGGHQMSVILSTCISTRVEVHSCIVCMCGILWVYHIKSPSRVSQRGYSPFIYRDGTGWPASLPYIRKIHVSVAIGTQSGIRLHKRVPMVKIWGSSKNDG